MYSLFDLSTRISTPIGIAGFIATILFFLVRDILKKNRSDKIFKLIVDRLFILSTISTLLGFAGWFWVNTGEVSLEGIVYIYEDQSRRKNVRSGVDIKVLDIRKPGRTDEYGRFSIPVKKSELKDKYTFQITYGKIISFLEVDDAFDQIRLNIYDTVRETQKEVKNVSPIKEYQLICSGRVIDENGKYIPIVNIKIGQKDFFSDSYGNFNFKIKSFNDEDVFELTVSKVSYLTIVKKCRLPNEQLTIVLNKVL